MNAIEQKLQSVVNDIAHTRLAGLPMCNSAMRGTKVKLEAAHPVWRAGAGKIAPVAQFYGGSFLEMQI